MLLLDVAKEGQIAVGILRDGGGQVGCGFAGRLAEQHLLIGDALLSLGDAPDGLVENGLGLAVVPQLTLPRDTSSVVGVRLDDPPVTRTIGLIRRAGRSLSPAAEAFVTLLMQASQDTAAPARRKRRA